MVFPPCSFIYSFEDRRVTNILWNLADLGHQKKKKLLIDSIDYKEDPKRLGTASHSSMMDVCERL